MPMSLRVELFVADVAASADFYRRVLGFEVERQDAGYASVRNGQVLLGLGAIANLPPEAAAGPSQERVRRGRGAGVEIVLEVDDLDAAHAAVLAAGHPLSAPLTERPWGLTDFRLTDPDGYYIRVTDRTAA